MLSVLFLLSLFLNTVRCFQQNAILVGTHIVSNDFGLFLASINILSKKVYRHGDRSPAVLYPTSTTDPLFWPNGLGQLTPRGQLQQIRLGKYLRERYAELLNTTYIASEVNMKFSLKDRAKFENLFF